MFAKPHKQMRGARCAMKITKNLRALFDANVARETINFPSTQEKIR